MAKAKSEHSSNLIAGLKFINLTGAKYCSIGNNQVSAFTENVAMGFPIEEDLTAQANIKYLLQSLLKASEHATITQIHQDKLHVKSDGLQVFVDCEKQQLHIKPDNAVQEINVRFTSGLETILPICSAFGDHIAMKTILIDSQSMFATNRHCLVEYWHGLNLPNNMIVGKKFCELILKAKTPVASIGVSKNSITIYFKTGAWIMGRIFPDKWIEPYPILNVECPQKEVPEELRKAIAAVPAFSEAGVVYVGTEGLQSHLDPKEGASYPVVGLPEGAIFGNKELIYFSKMATWYNPDNPKILYFFGHNLRGAISSRA